MLSFIYFFIRVIEFQILTWSIYKKSLKIFGERKEEKQESRRGHYSEIYYGAFSREYQFRETISEDKIKAAYQNGILELTIPKSAQSKPKQIEIK